MKRIVLSAAAFGLALCALAQNVGIGTATPGYKLDVMGRMRVQASPVNNIFGSAGIWFTDYRNNSDMVFAGMADSVNYGLYSDKAGIGWTFYYDARYGNVGIGRTALSGTSRLSLSHPSGASLNFYTGTAFSGGIQGSDSTLEIAAARLLAGTIGASAKDIILWPPPPPCNGQFCFVTSPGRIGMYVNAPAARLHIAATTGTNGVLIGSTTSTPAVGYMLNVDGKIMCEEVRVQNSTAWPDYVFEDAYQLVPLSILEKQVMLQKHLPGIPSAKDVTENGGVEVGTMQKQLLEKVEELYRYVFQLSRENEQLRQQITQISKK